MKHKLKQRMFNFYGKTCKILLNSWSYAVPEMRPTGVGSGETTLLIGAHTTGDTSQSTLRNVSVANAFSSSALGLFPSDRCEKPYAKKRTK